MSSSNGDGLPLLAAVKAHRVNKLESERRAAEVALSRLRPRPQDADSGEEPLPADEHEAPDEKVQELNLSDDNEQEGEQ
jgi:hypothetical protein